MDVLFLMRPSLFSHLAWCLSQRAHCRRWPCAMEWQCCEMDYALSGSFLARVSGHALSRLSACSLHETTDFFFISAFWSSRLACGVHLLRQGTRGPCVACIEADGSRLLATCSLCCESPGALAAVSLALCAESVVGVAVWSRMIRRRRE